MCGGHGGAWCKLVACCGGDGRPDGRVEGLHDVMDVMLRLLELHNPITIALMVLCMFVACV